MKRRLHRSPRQPVVPTASMADIAFLLIIFFMLTTTFSPERTQVGLPASQVREPVQENPAIVAITADGIVAYSDGERASQQMSSMDELQRNAELMVQVLPQKEFVIKADRGAPYRYIDGVLEALRNAGVKNIGLLTNQEMGGSARLPGGDEPEQDQEGGGD